MAGYSFLVLLYRHSIQVIFNRKVTTYKHVDVPRPHPAIESFNTHLLMLRPLEIIFRFLTAPLRVLPDVIVLGEVRCGTTNLCAHITSLSEHGSKVKCYPPFCPWVHPELDNKESFYFVGHYLGIVDPYLYRMAFPLIFTKWWEEIILGNMFFSFDGCAQYLSSPTAPYLIADAYKRSNIPPPILVVCIRHPVDQAISWWQYENNAMLLGESMGLKEWNTDLRSKQYPPKTIKEAFGYSQSSFVQKAYSDAECLVKAKLSVKDSRCLYIVKLPSWALTWPGGQLSIFGKGYTSNIEMFNSVFGSNFGQTTSNMAHTRRQRNKIGRIHIAPLEDQATGSRLKSLLRPVLTDVVQRCGARSSISGETLMHHVDHALRNVCASVVGDNRRNSNPQSSDQVLMADYTERNMLLEYFEQEISDMKLLLGDSLAWR
ncbi:hypothetical protein ACHAXN_002655 [Cyclotella atomus]